MAQKPHVPAAASPPRKPSAIFRPSVMITLVFVVVMGFLAVSAYRKWDAIKSRLASLETEQATLKGKNSGLGKAHEVLQNKKFQVCNRTADEVTIPWFSAAYQSGDELRVFDASRCEGWTPQLVLPGGSPKLFNFPSTQEGCNWDGSVLFYAMRITRTNEEGASQSFNLSGPWQGFDRDCFTIQ